MSGIGRFAESAFDLNRELNKGIFRSRAESSRRIAADTLVAPHQSAPPYRHMEKRIRTTFSFRAARSRLATYARAREIWLSDPIASCVA